MNNTDPAAAVNQVSDNQRVHEYAKKLVEAILKFEAQRNYYKCRVERNQKLLKRKYIKYDRMLKLMNRSNVAKKELSYLEDKINNLKFELTKVTGEVTK